MKKIEVFKDSKGNLFEAESEYIKSEYNIFMDNLEKTYKDIKEFSEETDGKISIGMCMFRYIKDLSEDIFENPERAKNNIKDKLELIDKYNKIIKEEKRKKYSSYSEYSESNHEDCPGYWRGISGTEMIGNY